MMPSWQQWLAKGDVKTHQTSKQEIDNLRALITRDLADAAVAELSADRRFATAYNAALQAATIAIACSGYRVSARSGHHKVTFEAAALAIGGKATLLSDYFETCRRKRNVIDYMTSSVATDTEAEDFVERAIGTKLLVTPRHHGRNPVTEEGGQSRSDSQFNLLRYPSQWLYS